MVAKSSWDASLCFCCMVRTKICCMVLLTIDSPATMSPIALPFTLRSVTVLQAAGLT